MKDLPDNITDIAHILPYASNVGAPKIEPDHSLASWKQAAVHNANKHYKDKFDELKSQFEQFAEEFKCNELMYNAEMRIKPVVGKVYHLYSRSTGVNYVSLFAPDERMGGREDFIGLFKLNYDNRWEPA